MGSFILNDELFGPGEDSVCFEVKTSTQQPTSRTNKHTSRRRWEFSQE